MQGGFYFLVVLVSAPRPEKALQAISLAPRDDVHVEMRNTLAYTIIDGHERAFRFHPLHDGLGKEPDIAKNCAQQRVWQIEERLHVALYDEQRVARKERAMVQEGQRNIILKNLEAGDAAANDIAESAVFLEHKRIFQRIFHLGICSPWVSRVGLRRKAAE